MSDALEDLSKHLEQRLYKVLEDYLDRCHEIDIDYEAATASAFAVLLHYTVGGAHASRMTEFDYLALCAWKYRKMANGIKRASRGGP